MDKVDKEEKYLRRKAERSKKKEFMLDHKRRNPCKICGESDLRCLSFHHRKPKDKRFTVHSGSIRRYSLKSIRIEISKCDVLCLNCHAKIHNGNGNGYSHKPGRSVK